MRPRGHPVSSRHVPVRAAGLGPPALYLPFVPLHPLPALQTDASQETSPHVLLSFQTRRLFWNLSFREPALSGERTKDGHITFLSVRRPPPRVGQRPKRTVGIATIFFNEGKWIASKLDARSPGRVGVAPPLSPVSRATRRPSGEFHEKVAFGDAALVVHRVRDSSDARGGAGVGLGCRSCRAVPAHASGRRRDPDGHEYAEHI